MIKMIACISRNRALGFNNDLIYKIREDMMHFKNETMGKDIVMGDRTLLSMGGPLKGRHNIVLSTDTSFYYTGCVTYNNIDHVLSIAEGRDVYVIGGGQIYNLFLPHADELILTVVDEKVRKEKADTWFPEFEEQFELVDSRPGTEEGVPYHFNTYKRKVDA